MKLDTLLELHSQAVRGAVQDAPIPDLPHTARQSRGRNRWGVAAVMALAAAGLVVAIVLGGPNESTAPNTGAPATQVSSTTAATSDTGGTSTTTVAAPADLEEAGVALQNGILADGTVTRAEFEQAVGAMADCMERHGLTGVTWSVEDDGTWGAGYNASEGSANGNAVEAADEAIYNLCYFSYVDRLGLPPMTTESTDSQSWLTVGEPVSDEQFLALVGDSVFGFVPGSVIRLAWSPAYLGRFDVGVFAVQIDLADASGGALSGDAVLGRYCKIDYAAPIGDAQHWAGGARCAESVDQFEAMISTFGFSGGGSCAGWLGNVADVWGVPPGVASVEFHLRDGTVLTADVDGNGYALVAWDVDTPLVAVIYQGISAENAAVLDLKPENAESCAEMSARKPG